MKVGLSVVLDEKLQDYFLNNAWCFKKSDEKSQCLYYCYMKLKKKSLNNEKVWEGGMWRWGRYEKGEKEFENQSRELFFLV